MARPVIRDFFTGLFALLGLIGLIVMLVLFGEFASFGKAEYEFDVHVASAGGLSDTSAVYFNGVKVGKVREVRVTPAPGSGADLRLRVRTNAQIPKSSAITIDRTFVGDASIEFNARDMTPAALADVITPNSTLDGAAAGSTLERLASSIQKPLARFEQTAASIEKLSETYTTLGTRLNELLEPRTLEEVAQGKAPNIRSTIARADKALADASAVLGDQQLAQQAKDILTRANTVLDDASALAKSWKQTSTNIDTQLNKASGSIENVAKEASGVLAKAGKAAEELTAVLEKVNKGDGTLGQLANNPELYNNLRDAASRVDKALIEFQLLVEKFRNEGLPLKF